MGEHHSNGHSKNPLDQGTWIMVFEGASCWVAQVVNCDMQGVLLTESFLRAEHERDGFVDVSIAPIYVFETMYVPIQQNGEVNGLPMPMASRIEHKLGMPAPLPPADLRASRVIWPSMLDAKIREHVGHVIVNADQLYRQVLTPSPIVKPSLVIAPRG